jgi:phosphoribosylformylglycinamidine cyclo-ligase
MPTTYKDAGLDLDVYEESMARLPRLMRRTFSPRVLELPDGFAGLFQLDFDNRLFRRGYREPVLIACTDGVGTKLKVAQLTGIHHTIGIDLVAMCVNDALCCGAEPLFFLDYVAMPKDDPEVLEQIVAGVSDGCLEADCALLGGETAILPEVYQPGEYDLAGFCVGVAERRQIIDGKTIAAGDVVLGVASSGLHSNGYSLVRKVVFEKAGLRPEQHIDELGQTVAEALLAPTRIYAQPLRKILQSYGERRIVHGVAHITGGGLRENLARIVPANVEVRLKPKSWPVPPVFPWLQRLGDIADEEMERVFNCGVGLVLVFNPHFQRTIQEILAEFGLESWIIGEVNDGRGDVVWNL